MPDTLLPMCRKTGHGCGVTIGARSLMSRYDVNVLFANTREIFTLSHQKVACSDMVLTNRTREWSKK